MNASFLLKKLVEGVLMPFPLSVLLIAIGTALLWLNRGWRAAKYMITAGIVMLIVLSNPYVGSFMVHSLEARFPPLPTELLTMTNPVSSPASTAGKAHGARKQQVLPAEPYILVLGGGANDDPELPESERLSSKSALRVVRAVQIYRRMVGSASAANRGFAPRIILSGGPTTNSTPEAIPMEKLAESLGVPADHIVLEDHSADTFTEAEDVFPTVGREPFILVTSAVHMPRAVALFRHLGMRPVPLPANYLSPLTMDKSLMNLVTDLGALEKTTEAWHERLGMVWEYLRGQS